MYREAIHPTGPFSHSSPGGTLRPGDEVRVRAYIASHGSDTTQFEGTFESISTHYSAWYANFRRHDDPERLTSVEIYYIKRIDFLENFR